MKNNYNILMKFLLLYLTLFTFTLAQPTVNITSDNFNKKDFSLGYFINNIVKLDFEDIKNAQFTNGKNKDTLGAEVKDVWIKIKLLNKTNKKKTLFLHQDLAFVFLEMEYFIVDSQDNLLDKRIIKKSSDKNENLFGSDAVIEFTLNAKESTTIYIHQLTSAYHFYNFSILNKRASIEHLIYEKVDAVLIFGLLISLALYNIFIYFSTRYKEYLYYTLYLISSTLWIVYVYGSLSHYLLIYNEFIVKFNLGLMLSPVFLALFMQSLLQTKIKYKKEHQILNGIIVILLLNLIFALVNFNKSLELLALTLNFSILVFLGIAISIYFKKNKIIKIFLLAHSFFIIFNTYGLLFYMGIVEFNYVSLHGVGIGIAIEAMLLSYLVSYKFKLIENEKEQEKLSRLDAIEKKNKSIEDNKKLKELLNERKLLLREVLHRVKNNFHMIIGMLWLHGNNAKDSTVFNELITKIKSMSQINDYLYKSENLTKIKIDEYLGDIITLSSSLTSHNKLKFDIDIENVEVSFETAMNLGLILNELLINSVKHNSDLDQIIVKVVFTKDKDTFLLTVHDNSTKFDPDNENKGIGLILIKDFSSKLHNSHYQFSFKNGTHFYLKFEN